MREGHRRSSVAGASIRRRAPWWQVAAVFAAIGTGAVALWQTIETRRSNAEQLRLFRTQLELAREETRPILVPVADPGLPLVDSEMGVVRFRLQNATNAPALSGVAVIIPPAANEGEAEGTDPYPSCGDAQPAAGHGTFEPIPPVPAGATVTVELQAFFEPSDEDFICASLDYIDARAEHRITDWIWARRETSPGSVIWIPIQIRLFDATVEHWWERPLIPGPVED